MTPADDHMQTREAEKAKELAEIAVVLNEMDVQRRHPDRWERACLVQAFAAIFSGGYSLAATEARLALVPPDQRSPQANLPSDPIFDQCDLPLLRRVFDAAQAEPASRFSHFGPVELKGATIKNPDKAWLW